MDQRFKKFGFIIVVVLVLITASFLVYNNAEISSNNENNDTINRTYDVSIEPNTTSIDKGKTVEFEVNINNYSESNIDSIILKYGDGNSQDLNYTGGFEYAFTKTYDTTGEFNVVSEVTSEDSNYSSSDSVNITVKEVLNRPNCIEYSFDGNGTEGDPYEVTNISDFQCIGENGYYMLESDIDATPANEWQYTLFKPKGFHSVGESTRVRINGETKYIMNDFHFNGTIDGNGYTISNLTINYAGGNMEAPIDGITKNGTLKDITFRNVNINGHAGAVYLNRGTISNVDVIGGVIDGTEFTFDERIGGLVAVNTNGIIENSYTNVTVKGNGRVGGVVGWLQIGELENTESDSTVIGPSVYDDERIGKKG